MLAGESLCNKKVLEPRAVGGERGTMCQADGVRPTNPEVGYAWGEAGNENGTKYFRALQSIVRMSDLTLCVLGTSRWF